MTDLLERPAVRRQVARWSTGQYQRLRDLGLVPERSELLRGVILTKMTKSPLHTLIVHRLWHLLATGLPADHQLRKEDPLTLTGSDSEPEPDLAVVLGTDTDFRDAHPRTATLVVEVAVSSIEIDRAKAPLYAGAGVPDYWLVLPAAATVEVYSAPGEGGYRQLNHYGGDAVLTTWYGARVVLADLFA